MQIWVSRTNVDKGQSPQSSKLHWPRRRIAQAKPTRRSRFRLSQGGEARAKDPQTGEAHHAKPVQRSPEALGRLSCHCVASWAQQSFTKIRLARCPLASINRLASRLGGAQSAPRPCARRPSPRAKVARGMPESPTLPAHAFGAAFHAGAFRLALGRGRMLRCFNPSRTRPQARSLPA